MDKDLIFKQKYEKYKLKYLNLKKQKGGAIIEFGDVIAWDTTSVTQYEIPVGSGADRFNRIVTVIGEVVLEDEIPVFDVAVKLVIVAGKPRSVGAVKVTLAVVFPAVAVPIIGAPGTLGVIGHKLNFFQKDCWSSVQIPEAELVFGVTCVLVIKPPGYCLDIRYLNV